MANRFSRSYPPDGRLEFDGGLNNKFDAAVIADNESPAALNVIFDNGTVETRGGTTKINTASVGSFVANGLYTRHERGGNQSLCAFYGSEMYVLSGTSLISVPSSESIFTDNVRVATAEYENYLFIGDGTINPYKYNSHFTRHGVPAPTATATAASNATGLITGDYQYKVSYVNSGLVEGDVGPVSTTFTAASATIRVSSVPTAPVSFGVGIRRIYRTENGGTTFKRVGTISDNTTTTFDDNIADSALGVTAPTDNGVPPTYSVIEYHADRLFCNDPGNENRVVYSNLGDPYTFASTNFLTVGDNTLDVVRAIHSLDNNLIVLCDESSWIIYMADRSTPSGWEQMRIKSPYGSKSPHGAFRYNNKIMHPAIQGDRLVGFAAISGDALAPDASFLTVSTAGSDLKSNRIEPDIFLLTGATIPRISATVFENKAYISVSYNAATENNRIYVFDFGMTRLDKRGDGSWVPWTGLNAAQMAILDAKLYYASADATGFIYKMNDGTFNDDSAAIDSSYQTKEFAGQDSDITQTKDFRYANLLFELAGDYFMNFNYKVDSDKGGGNTITIDLNPGGSLWQTMVWGRDVWGGGNTNKDLRQFLANSRGKRIQFKVTNQNTADQKFKLIGMDFVYNNKGRR